MTGISSQEPSTLGKAPLSPIGNADHFKAPVPIRGPKAADPDQARVTAELAFLTKELIKAEEDIAEAQSTIRKLQSELRTLQTERDESRQVAQAILDSTSWKMTGPLRALLNTIRNK